MRSGALVQYQMVYILVIGVPGEERMWVRSINNILRKLPKGGNHRSLFLNAIERRNKIKIKSLRFVHSSTRGIDMDSLLSLLGLP